MPNAAVKCCECRCAGGVCDEDWGDCSDPGDWIPYVYHVASSDIDVSGCPDELAALANGGFCLSQIIDPDTGAVAFPCFWRGFSKIDSRVVCDLIRSNGGFDVVIGRLYEGAGALSGEIGLPYFAGRVEGITLCSSTFTVDNETLDAWSPCGTGGTAVVEPCCPTKCFELWHAVYNCVDQEWADPVPIAKVCLPEGVNQDWFKSDTDGTTCTFSKYLPYGTNCPCDTLDYDTDPPDALPFDGASPYPQCCPCALPCASEIPCSTCSALNHETPSSVLLSFGGSIGNPKCLTEIAGNLYVYRVRSNLDGLHLALSQVLDPDYPGYPCMYTGNYATAVQIWRCVGDGTVGVNTCGSCDPYEDGVNITVDCLVELDMSTGAVRFRLTVDDTDLAPFGDPFEVSMASTVLFGIDCCDGFSMNITPATYSGGEVSSPDWNAVVGPGYMIVEPCKAAPDPGSVEGIEAMGIGEI